MSRAPIKKVAWKPLEDFLRARGCADFAEMGARLERDPRQLQRWLKAGGLPLYMADEVAGLAGIHPWNLWPELADQAVEEIRKAEETRDERQRRRKRDAARKRWRENKDFADRERERNRQWKRENPELNRQNTRNWYRQNADYARDYARDYRIANRETVNARERERYHANRDKRLEQQRAYRAKKKAEREAGAA